LETVGGKAPTASESVGIVAPGGTVIILGVFEPSAPNPNLMLLLVKEVGFPVPPTDIKVTISGACCYNHCHSRSDFSLALSILSEIGEALYALLVTHTYPLQLVEEAFRTACTKGTGGAIKVVFKLFEE
jgi:threonine dehydrogenase-like Zn-dependent dehydrogenase